MLRTAAERRPRCGRVRRSSVGRGEGLSVSIAPMPTRSEFRKCPVANGLARTARDSTEDREETTNYQCGADAGTAVRMPTASPASRRITNTVTIMGQQHAPDQKFRWREPRSISVGVELLAVPEHEDGLADGAEGVQDADDDLDYQANLTSALPLERHCWVPDQRCRR